MLSYEELGDLDVSDYKILVEFVKYNSSTNKRSCISRMDEQEKCIKLAAARFEVSEREILYALKSGEVINLSMYESIFLVYNGTFFRRDIDDDFLHIRYKDDLPNLISWCNAIGISVHNAIRKFSTDSTVGHGSNYFMVRDNKLLIVPSDVSMISASGVYKSYKCKDLIVEKKYKRFTLTTPIELLGTGDRVVLLKSPSGPLYQSERECAGIVTSVDHDQELAVVKWDDNSWGKYGNGMLAKADQDIKLERKWVIRDEEGNEDTSTDGSDYLDDDSSDSVSHESKGKNKKRDEEDHKGTGIHEGASMIEFDPDIVINKRNFVQCKTEEQAALFIEWAEKHYKKLGKTLLWYDNDEIEEEEYYHELYEENTVYSIYEDKLYFNEFDDYEVEETGTLISFEDALLEKTPKTVSSVVEFDIEAFACRDFGVRCKTEDEARKLFVILKDNGILWNDGEKGVETIRRGRKTRYSPDHEL